MKKKSRAFFLVAALAGIALTAAAGPGASEKIFSGEIADSQCALNVHSLSQSHKEMMGMKPEIKTDAECVRFCVNERGGRYMLQTKTKVYKLDAQVLAKEWAGQKVKLVGTLDPKSNIIAVAKIEGEATSPGTPTKPH
jgi:hypothetical protein